MPEKAMQKVWKIMPKWRPNGCQDRLKIWKYAKKGMAKINAEIWCWKICKRRFLDHFLDRSQLPTAIFPHRALEKRKREVKTSFGLCFEWIQKDYNRNCYKMHVKIIIFGPKTFKLSPKWLPKSMLNRWKIEVASRMRFWSGPWAPKGGFPQVFPDDSGSHFQQKNEKSHTNRHAKIDAEKVLKIEAKRLPKWWQNWCQNLCFFILFQQRRKCTKLLYLQ